MVSYHHGFVHISKKKLDDLELTQLINSCIIQLFGWASNLQNIRAKFMLLASVNKRHSASIYINLSLVLVVVMFDISNWICQ